MKKIVKKDIMPNCPICNHEDREGIEMLGLLAASSWRIAAKRINNTFGTSFTAHQMEEHMMHHVLHSTAKNAGLILDAITDDDSPVITPEVMMRQLLIQAALDIARGNIKCKTPDEVMRLIAMIEHLQENDTKYQMENGDAEGFWNAMSAYGSAINSTCSPEQVTAIVQKANALGAFFNIRNTPKAHPIDPNVERVLNQAAIDMRELGRTRTREELIADGVITQEMLNNSLPPGV